MSGLDQAIVLWLNQYAQTNQLFDGLVALLSRNGLRGAVIMALLWWAWMNSRTHLIEERLFWPKAVFGTFVAIGVARAMQNFLPTRPRPLHEPTLDFRTPFWSSDTVLAGWSSFPSDHAVLFAALTTAIFMINWCIGWLAALWTVMVILLPRIYVGLHYPSDILVGALIGAAVMLVVQCMHAPPRLTSALQSSENNHRGLFYAFGFIFSFLCATVFESLREILRNLPEVL